MFFKKKENNFIINEENITDSVIRDFYYEEINEKINEDEKEVFITDFASNGNKLIEIKNICKNFGSGKSEKKVLKDINFDINFLEHTALLGCNGAGKTVLSEIICGLNDPTSGEIIRNFDTDNYKKKIGIQFQDSAYPQGVTVKKVIEFIVSIHKSKISNDELKALIKIFGIEEIYDKSATDLSGGQQQRLNLLLSLIHKPEFIILDELSTGLDIKIKSRIKRFIKEYSKKHNITILIVSHDMDEIEYLTNRIIVMYFGKVYVDASKEEVIEKYGSIQKCIERYI